MVSKNFFYILYNDFKSFPLLVANIYINFAISKYYFIFAYLNYIKIIMEKTKYIAHAISAAIHLLNNEIQCVEDDELIEEYQEVINELEEALRLAKEMTTP